MEPIPRTDRNDVKGNNYYCSFVDKPFGLEKYVVSTVWVTLLHVFGIYGGYLLYSFQYPRLILPAYFFGFSAGLGVIMGAHRYWTHKTFKANLPLQILLAYTFTSAVQYPIFKWARDHRVHHKYSETPADPHNSTRGFWYSHIGWIVSPESKEFKETWTNLDYSDLDNDPVVRFQAKYYWRLVFVSAFIVPLSVMSYVAPGAPWLHLISINFLWNLHVFHHTLLINSVAHRWGSRPYDRNLQPTESTLVSFLAFGEGWHNYHHTFPWDYKTAELGYYGRNIVATTIEFFAKIGWAYDLKTVPAHVVENRVRRTGDGSHSIHVTDKKFEDSNPMKQIWGWGDDDLTDEVDTILMKNSINIKPITNDSG